MVSQQSTYRHLPPSQPRRQTLSIFHSPPRQVGNETKHGLETSSTLNRKWMHRSLGDLTSDHGQHTPNHMHQSRFYQELYQKYPHAFQHRLEEREATRRVFNARPQVRFDDEPNFDVHGQHISSVHVDRNYSHLTNWDREVGHYFKNRSNFRDCMTSTGTSEISGSPTRTRHFSSETLSRLLTEQSPLRRKFHQDAVSSRSEVDIQDYFLEKSRARTKHRRKHCRILQRTIEKSESKSANDKENSDTKLKQNHNYEKWTHHLDTYKRNYPSSEVTKTAGENRNSNKKVDVASVVANTDLKISALLEKISLKMSSPESLPDSAIDIDTPSVRSFVSAGKGGNMEMQLTELPILNGGADNNFVSSRDFENDFRNMSGDLDKGANKDFNSDNETAELDTVIEANKCAHNASNNENVDGLEHNVGSHLTADQDIVTGTQDTEADTMSETNTVESLSSDIQSVQSCVERPVLHIDGSHEVPAHTMQKYQNIDSDVDSGIGQSSTGPDIRERSRPRERTPNTNLMKDNQSVLPSRSEVDCCILDEVDLMQSNQQISLQRDSLNDIDDTADVRHRATEITLEEVKIAEKYRRTRSPSPYILLKPRRSGQQGRPNSAPYLITGNQNIKIVDISISDRPKSKTTSPNIAGDTSCQNADLRSASAKHIDCDSDTIIVKNTDNKTRREVNELFMPTSNCQRCSVSSLSSSGTGISNPDNLDGYVSELPREFVDDIKGAGAINVKKDKSAFGIENNNEGYAMDDGFNHFRTDHGGRSAGFVSDTDSMDSRHERQQRPAGLSPRVNEKRLKIREKTKNKSDNVAKNHCNNQAAERITLIDSKSKLDDRMNTVRDMLHEDGHNGAIARERMHKVKFDASKSDAIRRVSGADSDRSDGPETAVTNVHNIDAHIQAHPNDKIKAVQNRLGESEDDRTALSKYTDNRRKSDPTEDVKNDHGNDPNKSPETDAQRAPPVKPARRKHKKTPPKVQNTSDQQPNSTEASTDEIKPERKAGQHIEVDVIEKLDTVQTDDSQKKMDRQLQAPIEQDFDEKLPSARGNLENSKKVSASKTSLLDKFGTLKTATKGKFKKLRKAISLERGIDSCGVDMNTDPYKTHETKGDHSGQKKMKKAPSLKSFSNLFGRMKKKRGKWSAEEVELESSQEPSSSNGASAQLSSSKRQQWASCHTLSPHPMSSNMAPIGKLVDVNPDGTQLIQLFKPASGPMGFFIAKGTEKYHNGIFVSRLVESRSEICFAGLLGVGDEILEVNGHFVRDLSQDAVYKLISASPVVVMKVLPFIARKDV